MRRKQGSDRTDSDLLDWLAADETRLQDVYYRIQNENEALRVAIRKLMKLQAALAD